MKTVVAVLMLLFVATGCTDRIVGENEDSSLETQSSVLGLTYPDQPYLFSMYGAGAEAGYGYLFEHDRRGITQIHESEKQIGAFAIGPDNGLYFAYTNSIFKIENGVEVPLFTYPGVGIRAVAFDPAGRLYFSTRGYGDLPGYIYRLENNQAKVFLTLDESMTGGYWTGNFTFDHKGDLWFSSGNFIPSSIFKIKNGRAEKIYTTYGRGVMGLYVEPGGSVVFATFDGVYHLTIPGLERTTLYTHVPDPDANFENVHGVTPAEWPYRFNRK